MSSAFDAVGFVNGLGSIGRALTCVRSLCEESFAMSFAFDVRIGCFDLSIEISKHSSYADGNTRISQKTRMRKYVVKIYNIYMLIAKKNGNEEWRRKVRGGPSIYNVKRATICCVRRILLAARYMYIRYDLQAINVIPSPVQLIIADRDNGKMQTL